MGEPIRFKVQRDEREELFRKLQTAPAEHAAALLAAFELLQEAHDHGVLDTLRGAIGAGETFVSTAAGFANTPEGIRTIRNLLALVRLLGEVDPSLLDSVVQALGHGSRGRQESAVPPPLWHSLRRLTGSGSRRALATLADVVESFGNERNGSGGFNRRGSSLWNGAAVPVFGALGIVVAAALWMKRKN